MENTNASVAIDSVGTTMTDEQLRIAELEARIFSLEYQLRVLEATNAAHITVINEYSETAMARLLEWLQNEHEVRIRNYNSRLVEQINVATAATQKMEAFKAEARRAMDALAKFQEGCDGYLYEHDTGFGRHIGIQQYRNGRDADRTHFYKIVKTEEHRVGQAYRETAENSVGKQGDEPAGAAKSCERDDQPFNQGDQEAGAPDRTA